MMNSIKGKIAACAGLVAASLASFQASAALPAVVGTSLTEVQTDALAAIDLVWPVVMAVLGGFVVLKIVKRAAGKI